MEITLVLYRVQLFAYCLGLVKTSEEDYKEKLFNKGIDKEARFFDIPFEDLSNLCNDAYRNGLKEAVLKEKKKKYHFMA